MLCRQGQGVIAIMTPFTTSTIGTLVTQHPGLAKALHFMGINLLENAHRTLEEVCQERGLKPEVLIREMQVVGLDPSEHNLKLVQYPADIVMSYLRHTHHQFIKTRLPFLRQLVSQVEAGSYVGGEAVKDLQLVFPHFAEEFIKHIYEEEDQLFSYIELLMKAVKGKAATSAVFYAVERNSISHFSAEHEAHENEMAGLRALTNDFTASDDAPLSVKVLFAELGQLERDLIVHANVENRVLFPKALKLEHEVRYHILHRARLN